MSVSYYYLQPQKPDDLPASPEGEMLRVALAINEGNTVEELVDLIFETLNQQLPFDRIGLAFLEGSDILRARYARSRNPIILGVGTTGKLSGSSLELIIRENKIRIIDDLVTYYQEHPHSETTPRILKEGMRSSLTLPLVSRGRPIGIIFFASTRPKAYTSRHVTLLKALAMGLVIAFDRAILLNELRQANDELRTLDQLKINFLSNLSHELRTPLSIIMSYNQALEDEVAGKLSPTQHQYLHESIGGADRLRVLLNNLFDFTELESGTLKLDRIKTDVGAIVKEIANEIHPFSVNAGQVLNVHVPMDPVFVSGDPQRIAQVIRILADNARNFTPAPGEITLRVEEDETTAWIDVEDTGIGIGPAAQPHIFKKFYQAEGGPARTRGGVGLGLPLAKIIAEAHGGAITFTSQLGRGSNFRFTLPRV